MGQFFRPHTKNNIWYYSERGLLQYLFHQIHDGDLSLILENAENASGMKLIEVIKSHTSHLVLNEFNLGSNGFGCPDGGILTDVGQPSCSFIFVEGKAVKFRKAFRKPETLTTINAKLLEDDGRQRIRRHVRGFNSLLNGQLELRWRFVNALRASVGKREVSERHLALWQDYIANDKFYWKRTFQPDPTSRTQWRRIKISDDFMELRKVMDVVQEFYLLAITTDSMFPHEFMSQVRLVNGLGEPLADITKYLYWMSLDRVKERLERSPKDGNGYD